MKMPTTAISLIYIGFIDNISIFAETPEGMQTLLDVVRSSITWCNMDGVEFTNLV